MVELSIKVSNSEQSYTQKWLEYDGVNLSKADVRLQEHVQEAVKNFNGNVDNVDIRARMAWE